MQSAVAQRHVAISYASVSSLADSWTAVSISLSHATTHCSQRLRRYIDELLLPGGGGGAAMADKLAKADFHGAMVRVVRQSPLTRTLSDRTAVAWQHLRALCLYHDALYIYLTPR